MGKVSSGSTSRLLSSSTCHVALISDFDFCILAGVALVLAAVPSGFTFFKKNLSIHKESALTSSSEHALRMVSIDGKSMQFLAF